MKKFLRKTLTLVMSFMLLFSMMPQCGLTALAVGTAWDGTKDTSWYNSSDTSFTISTAAELAGLSDLVNCGNTFQGKTVTLAADINLNGKEWTPIGNNDSITFSGNFDGGGHEITGLQIGTSDTPNSTIHFVGLFGCTNYYTVIKNTGVNANIYSSVGGVRAGGLVGANFGTITGCHATGTITTNNDGLAGGLVGINYRGSIINCYATAVVTGNQSGGFIGWIDRGTVLNCYATGAVTGNDSYPSAGGFVGYSASGTVANCFATGNVSADNCIGGFAGFNDGTYFTNCYALGSATGSDRAGGFTSHNDKGTITNCYWNNDSQTTGVKENGSNSKLQNVTGIPSAAMKGTAAPSTAITYYTSTTETAVTGDKDTGAFIVALNGGRSAITGLPSGVSAKGWGNYGTSINNGYPMFGVAAVAFTKGDGSSENPYQISSAENLVYLQQLKRSVNCIVTADIDLSDIPCWTPIGDSYSNKFSGNFDGGGHEITGLQIGTSDTPNSTMNFVGLFGYTDNNTVIKNTGVNANIYSSFGGVRAGGLVGANFGTITGCQAIGKIIANNSGFAGGLVGFNYDGSIINCYATAVVTGNESGGFIGWINRGTVLNCYATGVVTGNDSYPCAGGFVGYSATGTVANCFATGNVSGNNCTGGFAGFNDGASFTNCYALGLATGSDRAGGFTTCNNNGTITNCYWNNYSQTTGVKENPSGNLQNVTGISSDAMNATAAPGTAITYYKSSTETAVTNKDAGAFVEALNGGRSAITGLPSDVSAKEWGDYGTSINNGYAAFGTGNNLPAPTITLSSNSTKGGVDYTISPITDEAAYTSQYLIKLYDNTGNIVSGSPISVTSLRGNIPLFLGVVGNRVYTAKVMAVASPDNGYASSCYSTACASTASIDIRNTGKAITSFSMVGNSGVIDESAHTIAVTVPYGTNLKALTPVITTSDKAATSPAGGTVTDFTSPVTYTVTAENTLTETYTVTVTAESEPTIDVSGNPSQWVNTASLNIVSTAGISGIKSVTVNGTDITGSYIKGYKVTQNGSYTFTITSNAGSVKSQTVTVTKVDSTVPNNAVITDLANYTSSKWFASDQTISAAFTKTDGSNERLQYNVNDKVWTDGSSVVISQEGSTNVKFRVIDELGRTSKEQTVVVQIDKTAPINAKIVVKDKSFTSLLNTITFGYFFKDTVDVSITGDDIVSGIKSIQYQKVSKHEDYKENGTWAAYSNSFSVWPDDKFIIYAKITDKAGNYVIINSDGIIVDKTSPDLSVNAPTGWQSGNVTANVSVSDSLAGVKTVSYSTDEKTPQIGTVTLTNGNGTITLSNDGQYTLKVTAEDNSGNAVSKTADIKIDKTVPTINITGNPSSWVPNAALTVNAAADISGIKSVTVNGTDITNSYTNGYKVIQNGSYKFVVTNGAGVTAEQIVTVSKVDSNKVYVNSSITTNVLEAVKGIDKLVSFTVESQGITLTWTFNGKDVTDTTKSVDLTLNAVAPNKDLIAKVDSNAEIISFKNHGILPAPMTITIPVDTKKFDVTKPINCYYYNETTKKAELIAENLKAYQKGDAYYVDVTITHCSDYFLSASYSKTVLPKVEKLVKTGSPIDMNVLVGLGMLLIGTGFVVVLSKRKRS